MKYDFSIFVEITSRSGNQIMGRCPLHSDRNPSFSGNEDSGLWKCFAGCGQGDFNWLEYLIEAGNHWQSTRSSSSGNQRKLDWTGYTLEAEYTYTGENGDPVLRVKRFFHRTKAKRFLQEHRDESGRWVNGKGKASPCPYLFPEWRHSSEPIIFVEGEKCADRLWKHGFMASTTPGGSNAWNSSFAPYFKGKEVILIPDNDDPGQRFCDSAIRDISQYAKLAQIMRLPDLENGEDVVDWFLKGNLPQDLRDLISRRLS